MYRTLGKTIPWLALLCAAPAQAAVDSYHYLHVTIETPWAIFLILLPMVLAPMVLMGVMVWRYAERKKNAEQAGDTSGGKQE